jgi:hypothetical protein
LTIGSNGAHSGSFYGAGLKAGPRRV